MVNMNSSYQNDIVAVLWEIQKTMAEGLALSKEQFAFTKERAAKLNAQMEQAQKTNDRTLGVVTARALTSGKPL
jgi:regulatory protein YycI of two-component signal transduction system YycFG